MLREKLISSKRNVMRENLERLADELLQSNKKFVVWGCGNTGQETIAFLNDYSDGRLIPQYIVDNNKSRWLDNNVKSPIFFDNDKENIDIVIVCVYVADQVIEQIKEMNYSGRVIPVSGMAFRIDDARTSYLDANMEQIEMMYEMLADEQSKKTVETFLNFMHTGDIDLWDEVNDNSNYKLVDPDVMIHNGASHFVDIGAFTGDTLRKFLELNDNNYQSIVCIEPDINNFLVLKEYIENNKLDRTMALNMAAGKENGVLRFSNNRSESCVLSEDGQTTVKVLALDTLPEAQNVSMLKVSTNGFDLNALIGAQEIIKRNKPQIACYASGEQLWKVPQFLKKIVPEYKIFYRHYGIGSQAMICYAKG